MDITIVIPTYNRKALLKHTLATLLRSPSGSVPVIVVDNGSTDDTMSFLQEFTSSHPTVTAVVERESGAAAARNRGLSLVQTRWVYFFDSDDEFEDIPHQWDSTAQLIVFPTRQRVDGKTSVRTYRATANPALHILNSMLNTQCMIFRTEWLKEIGGWNTSCRIWDDWELGVRALLHTPQLQWITDRPYHTARVHSDSLTGPSFKSRYKMQLEAIGEALKETSVAREAHIRHNCIKALMLRTYILSGKLLYEGDKKAAHECHTFISKNFDKQMGGGCIGYLLEQYTAMGGRGAWRIASWSLHLNKKR